MQFKKIMIHIRKEMLNKGLNVFRGSDDQINEQFLQWNSKAEYDAPGYSMKIPETLRDLYSYKCADKNISTNEITVKLLKMWQARRTNGLEIITDGFILDLPVERSCPRHIADTLTGMGSDYIDYTRQGFRFQDQLHYFKRVLGWMYDIYHVKTAKEAHHKNLTAQNTTTC